MLSEVRLDLTGAESNILSIIHSSHLSALHVSQNFLRA